MSGNIEATDTECLAKLAPCDCGKDEIYEVPEGKHIIGIFGLTKTDKLCDIGVQIRELENINSIGFITATLRLP